MRSILRGKPQITEKDAEVLSYLHDVRVETLEGEDEDGDPLEVRAVPCCAVPCCAALCPAAPVVICPVTPLLLFAVFCLRRAALWDACSRFS